MLLLHAISFVCIQNKYVGSLLIHNYNYSVYKQVSNCGHSHPINNSAKFHEELTIIINLLQIQTQQHA